MDTNCFTSNPEKARLNTRTLSVNAPQMASGRDETRMKHRLQFADSLKDLKNLKKQLYAAADCFESSYNKDKHKQFVVESSRDYVGKALVSSVDHLGCVADKLNKYLDEKANEFSTTITQLSLIEQRLSTYKEFIYLRGLSEHLLKIEEDSSQHKHRILPEENFASAEPKVLSRNCDSSVPDDVRQPKKQQNEENFSADNPFSEAFRATNMKMDHPPLIRKEVSRMPSREASPNPRRFSFSKMVPSKQAERRSVSPLRFPFNLSGSAIKRSVSPTPSVNRGRWASEPRRAISACRRRNEETMSGRSREKEMEESYTRRSKHLFKALLSLHHSRKQILQKQG